MYSLSNDIKKEENQEVVTFEKLVFGLFAVCCWYMI